MVGHVLPIPQGPNPLLDADGNDTDPLASLRADIAGAKGRPFCPKR